jgi:predicted acetyltransferase
VRYHFEEHWDRRRTQGVLHIDELHALSDEASRDLWRLVCGMEWVATVRAETRGPQERLPWLLTDRRAAQPEAVTDGLWVALLDLPRALEARSYTSSGRLVMGVTGGTGAPERLLLDASPEGTTCRPTAEPWDVAVDRRLLGAAYLGDAPLVDIALGGGVDEQRPGALALLDRLLRTPDAPWCSSYF